MLIVVARRWAATNVARNSKTTVTVTFDVVFEITKFNILWCLTIVVTTLQFLPSDSPWCTCTIQKQQKSTSHLLWVSSAPQAHSELSFFSGSPSWEGCAGEKAVGISSAPLQDLVLHSCRKPAWKCPSPPLGTRKTLRNFSRIVMLWHFYTSPEIYTFILSWKKKSQDLHVGGSWTHNHHLLLFASLYNYTCTCAWAGNGWFPYLHVGGSRTHNLLLFASLYNYTHTWAWANNGWFP